MYAHENIAHEGLEFEFCHWRRAYSHSRCDSVHTAVCPWPVSASVKSGETAVVDSERNTLKTCNEHVCFWTHFEPGTVKTLLLLPMFHDPYIQWHHHSHVQDSVRDGCMACKSFFQPNRQKKVFDITSFSVT